MNGKPVLIFVVIFATSLLLCVPTPALSASESFPSENIVWIVPYTPGGGFDTYSRAVARFMPKYLPNNVKVIIKNLPGAGSRRGTSLLYKAKPDGYTVGILNILGLVSLQIAQPSKSYDLSKFVWVGEVAKDTVEIAAAANSPFRTLEDLQKAERIRFADAGPGSGSWVGARLLKGVIGVNVVEVTGYQGSAQFVMAVIKGDSELTSSFLSSSMRYVRTGDLRIVFVFTIKPDPLSPSTQTLKGTAFEELAAVAAHRVVAAPPGTPRERVKILEDALGKTLKSKEMQKWSQKSNRPLYYATSEETAENILRLRNIMKKHANAFK